MKTGFAITLAALGCLLHHAVAEDDSPKRPPAKHAPAKDDDSSDADAKPKKHIVKKKAVDSDDGDAKPEKKTTKSDTASAKKDKGDDSDDADAKPKKHVASKKSADGDDSDKSTTDHSSKADTASSKKDGDGKADKDADPAKKEKEKIAAQDPANADKKPEVHPAVVSSIRSDELLGFDEYPAEIQSLIESSLDLTHLKLTYLFGGSSPSEGGMDCSGTINYVLTQHGVKNVPRSSDEICQWVRERSGLHLAPDGVELANDAFSALRPGDLLFWTGTYETLPRKLPVSHIMMYLGVLKKTGKPVVFGSSDGRSYAGERLCGVSVFDFNMPRAGGKAAFFGYGTIPGLSKLPRPHEEVRKAVPPPDHQVAMVNDTAKKSVAELPEDDTPAPKKAKAKVKVDGDADADSPAPAHKKSPPVQSDPPKPKKPAEEDLDVDALPKAPVNPPATPKPQEDTPAKEQEKANLKALVPGAKPDSDTKAKPDAEADSPKPKPKVDADDDDEKKEPAVVHKPKPAPKKKSSSSSSTARRKSSDDDNVDPAQAVRKVVNSIRRVFD